MVLHASCPRALCAALTILLLLAAPAASAVQPQSDDPIDSLLEDHSRWMEFDAGAFGGGGADWLVQEAGSAEFLVVGEQHGTRETPALMSWLLGELRPAGYEAYGVEIGPVSARMLEGMARSAEPMEALTDFFVSTPFSVPFFWWREELESFVTAVEEGYEIWGLDQEFVGSGRVHLARLRELAPDDAARALVDSWWQREMEGLAHYQRTQSTDEAIFMTITDEDLGRLRGEFAGVAEAQEILDEIAGSALPYQLFRAGENYRSNYERIRLIKRHLNDYLKRPGGPEPTGGGKVVLKFGAVHSGRGYSPLHQLDVGNQAAELAALRGGDSLNVLVTARVYRPLEGDTSDLVAAQPHLAPMLERVEDGRWGIFDLRALRPLLHTSSGREGREQLADTAWAYDLLIVAPAFHQAREIGG